MLVVVIDIPYDIGVRYKIYFTVVKCRDAGKNNRRTVCLYSLAVKIILKVVVKVGDRDSLVCIVACKVNCSKRNELDLGMRFKNARNISN